MLVGLGLTAAWIAAICSFVIAARAGFWSLRPNELGDFVAGASAPLAFLWLVIAVFLQKEELGLQRQELMHSRRALQMQAEELRRLVEQTSMQVQHSEREWLRGETESYFSWLPRDLQEVLASLGSWSIKALLEKDQLEVELANSDFSGANKLIQELLPGLEATIVGGGEGDWKFERFSKAVEHFARTIELIITSADRTQSFAPKNRLKQEGWLITRDALLHLLPNGAPKSEALE